MIKTCHWLTLLLVTAAAASAQSPQIVDVPSRPGVTQRILVITPGKPKAAVILFAGGDGGLTLEADGRIPKLAGNFLVRSRQLFTEQGLTTVVIDAPSDRQSPPFLSGYRQTDDHVADVKAIIAWLRQQSRIPVAEGGPDGIVLTSTIVSDPRSRAVPDMALDRLRIPVLVAHHREDGCRVCLFSDVPRLMERLTTPPRKELLVFDGGISTGDPCEARAHHGFNGIEREVVTRIAAWLSTP